MKLLRILSSHFFNIVLRITSHHVRAEQNTLLDVRESEDSSSILNKNYLAGGGPIRIKDDKTKTIRNKPTIIDKYEI